MKTSKRTPRRKVIKTRSIDPFGDDIFDIIDYYFTRKAAFEKGREEVLDQYTWSFRDEDDRVLARGNSKEELAQNIFDMLKEGGDVREVVFGRLKWMVREAGPSSPAKKSFAGMVKSSGTPEELIERLDKIRSPPGKYIPAEELKRNKFTNFLASADPRDIKKFIRGPSKK